jgi:hypothetical protein
MINRGNSILEQAQNEKVAELRHQAVNQLRPSPESQGVDSIIQSFTGRVAYMIGQAENLLGRTGRVADRMFGIQPPDSRTNEEAPHPAAMLQNMEMHLQHLQVLLSDVEAQVSRLESL